MPDWQDEPPIDDFEENVPPGAGCAWYWVRRGSAQGIAKVSKDAHVGWVIVIGGRTYFTGGDGKHRWWPVAIEPPRAPDDGDDEARGFEPSTATEPLTAEEWGQKWNEAARFARKYETEVFE